jgi:acyl-CoA thioesterase-2
VRRVVAIQHGRPIFNLAASFQRPEQGLEHQDQMPDVPGPDGLPDVTEIPADILQNFPEKMRRFFTEKRPFEFRPVRPMNFAEPEKLPAVKQVWIKTVDKLTDDPVQHQNMLAYVSDYELLGTSTLPHGLSFVDGNVQMASLDHALWFHRPVRVDEWLLYSFDSPNASGARGFARGQFFTREGTLVASTAQEGLVRVVDPAKKKPRQSDPRLQA